MDTSFLNILKEFGFPAVALGISLWALIRQQKLYHELILKIFGALCEERKGGER